MAGGDSCGEKIRLLNLFPLHPPVNGVHASLARSFFTLQPKKSGEIRLLNLFPIDDSSPVDGNVHAPVAKSQFTLPPKKRFTSKDNSSVDDINHPPLTISLSSTLPIKERLSTSKNNSSVDNIHTPVTRYSSSDLPVKKRLRLRLMGEDLSVNFQAPEVNFRRKAEDSLKKTECAPEFASKREEDNYYAVKIQKLREEMRDKFGCETGLATKKITKRCSRFHDEVVPRDDYVEKKKKKQQHKKKKKFKMSKLPPATAATDDNNNNLKTDEEQLRQFITGDEIKGSDMRLFIQKKLFESDLKRDQNRLNMPIKKLKTQDILKPKEKHILEMKEDNGKVNGIEVGLVGPNLQMYEKSMVMKLWEMRNNKNYVLTTNWNDFVADNINHLKKERHIRVWSFRRDEQLCFAISIV